MVALKIAGWMLLGVIGIVVGFVALGQLSRSIELMLALVLVVGGLFAVTRFRRWSRRDTYSNELDPESGGSTWGRVRTRRDPGREMDELTR